MQRVQAVWLLVLLAVAGCGGPPAPVGFKRYSLEALPKVGERQGPFDEGLLEVAPPEGWNQVKGRTFLIGYSPGKASELPRITISAQDPPPGSPAELTEEEAPALAAAFDQELRKAVAERKKSVPEYCLPIVLGETPYIRHVRQAPHGGTGTPCIVQSLQTIRNARLYTVELIVEIDAPQASQYEESLKRFRDVGYAVAANLHFAPPGKKFDPLAGFQAPQPKDDKTTKSAAKSPPKPPAAKTAESPPPAAKPAAEKPKPASPPEKIDEKSP